MSKRSIDDVTTIEDTECNQTKMLKTTENSINGSTTMFDVKSKMLNVYGADSLNNLPSIIRTLTQLMECKLSELTMTCLIPIIAIFAPDHLWSEMTCPKRWRHKFRAQTYWTTNDLRESEYQQLLKWMNDKSTVPLAKWQSNWFPKYGEEMLGTYLTYLSQEEIGQLIEFVRIYTQALHCEYQSVCTLSANTATTYTLPTPATMPQTRVDVASWSIPLPSNYVDDDEFERMFESYGSARKIGPTYLNTYVHRPELSKKWAASALMEDYVIDIHIYQYVVRNFIRHIDYLFGIEHNRHISYIKTGLPGKRYVVPKYPHEYWEDPRVYRLSLDLIENKFHDRMKTTLWCTDNLLLPFRMDNMVSFFVQQMCTSKNKLATRCNVCTFYHEPHSSYDTIAKDFPLLNSKTINHIVMCSTGNRK